MVQQRIVTFRPNIVIGLGGMGTSLAARIKRLVTVELDRQVAMGLILKEQKTEALAGRFQFIGFDSWQDPGLPGVEPYLELDKFYPLTPAGNVDQLVETRVATDQGFAQWWPRNFKPGSFTHGCGHVHAKGRLAYLITKSLTPHLDASTVVGTAINNALMLVENLPGQGRPIPAVWVCCSLAGGTGGGLFLTILQTIAGAFKGTIKLYGVVVDSSIASLETTDPARKTMELANNLTGLIETDCWLNPDERIAEDLGWRGFLPSDRQGQGITGVRPCADMVWLFHQNNMDGNAFGEREQQDAIAAVADTIATWIHSSTTAAINAMDADIDAWINNFGTVNMGALRRPALYGSIGISHLEYPAHRVLEYVSASVCLDAIGQHLAGAGSGSDITDLVGDFLTTNHLREEKNDDLVDQYQALTFGLPAKPLLANDLRRNQSQATVEAAASNLNAEGGRIATMKQRCKALTGQLLNGTHREAAGLRDQLLKQVQGILLDSPDGTGRAIQFLNTLKSRIDDKEANSIELELKGEGRMKPGFEADVEKKKASLPQQIKDLRGALRIKREGKIRTLVEEWWDPYVLALEKIVVREEVLSLYQALGSEIDTLTNALETIKSQVDEAKKRLIDVQTQALIGPDLGNRGGRVTYVLSKEEEIKRAFPAAAEDAKKVSEQFMSGGKDRILGIFESVLAAKRDTTRGAAGRLEALKKSLSSQIADCLMGLTKEEVRADVEGLSVWDALDRQMPDKVSLAEKVRNLQIHLDAFRKGASPMFPADTNRIAAEVATPPVQSAVLVYDKEAATSFGTRISAAPNWEHGVLVDPAAVPHPVFSPDPHRITLLHRLIGFPGLAIRQSDLEVGRTAYHSLPDKQLAWSDRRAASLPLDFEAITDAPKDEATYAAALALGWQVYPYRQGVNGTVNRRSIMSPLGTVFANGMRDYLTKISNPKNLQQVVRYLGAEFQQVSQVNWPARVQAARDFLQEEWNNVQKPAEVTDVGSATWDGQGDERYKGIDMLLGSVTNRLDYVNQQFNPNNPRTHDVLSSLMPKAPAVDESE